LSNLKYKLRTLPVSSEEKIRILSRLKYKFKNKKICNKVQYYTYVL